MQPPHTSAVAKCDGACLGTVELLLGLVLSGVVSVLVALVVAPGYQGLPLVLLLTPYWCGGANEQRR